MPGLGVWGPGFTAFCHQVLITGPKGEHGESSRISLLITQLLNPILLFAVRGDKGDSFFGEHTVGILDGW